MIHILGGVRTPIGKFGGTLRALKAVELGAHVVKESLDKASVDASDVGLCSLGLARQAGNGPNPGRLVSIAGGLSVTTPAFTVQQACLSGMLAISTGANALAQGDADVAIAAGVEHMSSVPHLSFDMRWGTRMGTASLVDAMFHDGFIDPMTGKHMGALTDALAARYGISREEQDDFALRSQRRWALAREARADDALIAPLASTATPSSAVFDTDELPRPDSTRETLGKLRPAFDKNGSVTAGNACGLADGAAAVVLATEDAVKRLKLKSRARIIGIAFASVDPADFPIAPVASTRRLLARLGMKIDDFAFVEANEAFAAQMIACMRDLELDGERVNPWGGAIAVGHPIGMSGIRIVLNVVHELETLGGRYGLAMICGNGGQGASIAVERVA
ncbi:MAG: acetyl-CoA C-acetyltransferase [Vulcanimicrobiaceae bacterium]